MTQLEAKAILICLGMDAFRAVLGMPTKRFTVQQIIDWLKQRDAD